VTLSIGNIPNHNHDIEYKTTTTKGGIWGSGNNNGGNYGWDYGTKGYAYAMSIVNYPGLSAVTIPTPLSYGVVYYIAAN
jgi:hypothetical protein